MKLNLGCGPVWLVGYLNVDVESLAEIAARARTVGLPDAPPLGADFLQADLSRPWPWADNSAEAIIADNLLEHLGHAALSHLLQEALRVLAPGAAMTGRVPDIDRIVAYANEQADWSWEPAWALGGPYRTAAYNALQNMAHGWGHEQVFTARMLEERLTLAGFETTVEPCETHGLRYSASKPLKEASHV